MLNLVLFVFSAVVIVSEAAVTPACSPVSPNVFFPVEGDCNKYMKCAKGVVSVHRCPPGMYFNPENWQCADPAKVKCNQDSITCSLNAQNVFSPVKGDCTKYRRCDNGVINTYDCPAGLHFNLEKFVCDYPENAHCDHDIPACSPVSPNTFFPVKGDCTKYRKCAKGVISTHVCPAGLYFNPKNWQCADPAKVNCKQDVPTCGTYAENVFFRVQGDCSKFQRCDHGEIHTFECPAGLYFNVNTSVCDYPANVQCPF